VVHVLGTGRRCAAQSRPIVEASEGGGSRSDSELSGLFIMFLKSFLLRGVCVCVLYV